MLRHIHILSVCQSNIGSLCQRVGKGGAERSIGAEVAVAPPKVQASPLQYFDKCALSAKQAAILMKFHIFAYFEEQFTGIQGLWAPYILCRFILKRVSPPCNLLYFVSMFVPLIGYVHDNGISCFAVVYSVKGSSGFVGRF